MSIRKLLLPLTGTAAGEAALMMALDIAREHHPVLILIGMFLELAPVSLALYTRLIFRISINLVIIALLALELC